VRPDLTRTEHVLLRVTAPTIYRFLLFERVRSVAAKALRVPALEQRRSRNDRLVFGVASDARGARVERGSVLVLVAGLATLGRRPPAGRVRGVDPFVAALARSRLGLVVLVRPMALQALLRPVHDHRRHRALRAVVATLAISRRKRRQLRAERTRAAAAEAARGLELSKRSLVATAI
jgi:hypothetical protein